MGNCLRSNKVTAYSPPAEAKKVECITVRSEKAVRFELPGEDEICGGSESDGGVGIGVVRIKVVMSRKELRRILEGENGNLEKLIGELAVKSRSRIVVSDAGIEEVEDGNGRWTPALESIPEYLD